MINCGERARQALQRVLSRAGVRVGLVEIHTWSREQQGRAYLWAIAFAAGREDIGPPPFIFGRTG